MLCDDCQQEHYDWIQQPPPKRRPEVWGNPALTLMNMRNHAEDWRKTVKYHTQLIRNHCEENHQNFHDQGGEDERRPVRVPLDSGAHVDQALRGN